MKKALFLILIAMLAGQFVFGLNRLEAKSTVYTICPDSSDKNSDCDYYLDQSPCPEHTINCVISNVAVSGDVIRLSAGVYELDSRIRMETAGVSLVGAEWQGASPRPLTVIRPADSIIIIDPGACAVSIMNSNVVVSNLLIEDGFPDHSFGVAPNLSNITISGNYTTGNKSGVAISGPQSNAGISVFNNVFAHASDLSSGRGNGVDIGSNVNGALLKNNTIYSNEESGISVNSNSNIVIKNNIIASNGVLGIAYSYPASGSPSYNNIHANLMGNSGGATDISYDPLFADAGRGDFRLQEDSPSIDAGDPNDSFGLEPQPNGGRINQGAFGNTAGAQITADSACIEPYPGMTITEDTTLCSGDNQEGAWQMPLANNLAAALKVGAGGITITCEQGTILQGGDYKGIGLFNPGYNNVTVENCGFQGFDHGILIIDSNYNHFKNVKLSDNKRGLKLAQNSKIKNWVADSVISNNTELDLAVFRSNLLLDLRTYNGISKKRVFLGQVRVITSAMPR